MQFSLLFHWQQMSLNMDNSGLMSLHYKISEIQKALYEVTFESSVKSWSDSDFLLCCGNLTLSVTWGSAFIHRKDCLWTTVSFPHWGIIFFSKHDLLFCFSLEIHLSSKPDSKRNTQHRKQSVVSSQSDRYTRPQMYQWTYHTHIHMIVFLINFSFLRQVLFM